MFAGSFAFGTLLVLPNTTTNFDLVSDLLAIAFVLFASSILCAIAVQYLLRRHMPSEALLPSVSIICQGHIVLMILLISAGFVVLNLVLINIGRKAVGVTGIATVGVVPIWFVCERTAEALGTLAHPPRHSSGHLSD